MADRFEIILHHIAPLRRELMEHPIYRELQSIDTLRVFMEQHVFAVWDFMSLLKALQQRVCCVNVPWIPNANPGMARFVNEIVLAEETDVDQSGSVASHFDLYRNAMLSAGAQVDTIDQFIEFLKNGESVDVALQSAQVPRSVASFVTSTFRIIESNDLAAIASAFTFGREDLLPDVFQQLVENLNGQSPGDLGQFLYYLDRHIELDGDEHGPLAKKLMMSICGDDDACWTRAEEAAMESLRARKVMWDGMLNQCLSNSLPA